jgi:flagellar secretion chaperone FliS
MSFARNNQALKEYGQVATQAQANTANPHRLITMLLDGAMDKIAAAKGFMLRSDVAQKSSLIGGAVAIVNGLRMSLDKKIGGDIAQNLDALYEYMGRVLMEANVTNNTAKLDEVSGLLSEIRSAWVGIPENIQNMPREELEQKFLG